MLDFLMSEQVLRFDLAVFEAVSKIWNPVLDVIMKTITYMGEAGIIWILLAIVLFLTKKYRKAGVAIAVALIVMEILNNVVLKNAIARPRPCWEDNELLASLGWWFESYEFPYVVGKPHSYSFPSGHTSSAFAASVAFLWYDRKYGIPTFIFAAIMGFTRLYVHVHYCTDIIGGVIVGVIYALIGVGITTLIFKFLGKYIDKVPAVIKSKKEAK